MLENLEIGEKHLIPFSGFKFIHEDYLVVVKIFDYFVQLSFE
jgi:hypothetical protein